MTRISLARIIADELATLRRFDPGRRPSGKARRAFLQDGSGPPGALVPVAQHEYQTGGLSL
jgi:hypothetical protein